MRLSKLTASTIFESRGGTVFLKGTTTNAAQYNSIRIRIIQIGTLIFLAEDVVNVFTYEYYEAKSIARVQRETI